eukprot:1178461-Prorocentrum_minimum.AAC.1
MAPLAAMCLASLALTSFCVALGKKMSAGTRHRGLWSKDGSKGVKTCSTRTTRKGSWSCVFYCGKQGCFRSWSRVTGHNSGGGIIAKG